MKDKELYKSLVLVIIISILIVLAFNIYMKNKIMQKEGFSEIFFNRYELLPDKIYIGDALINLKKLNIEINNKNIKINPQEKKVLEKMLESPGKVFSRTDIGKIINISKERTIDVMITRLRQKIESDPKNPKYLQTIRGSGYVLWIE